MAVSKRLRYEILRRDEFKCRYCHKADVELTVDHVVPVALGGTDDATNLAAACKSCNSGKTSTTPGAPLVAQVHDDAMRWQVAWNAAVAEAELNGQERGVAIAVVRQKYVAACTARHGSAPILGDDADASIGRWIDLGLPLTLIDKAISSAIGRDRIKPEGRFAYFAGCCWSLLREIQERTQCIVKASEANAESWEEMYTTSVIDTAVMTWRESWMEKHGANPSAGLEEQVRASALDLFPEYIGAADLIGAAELAAGCKDVNLKPFSEELADDEEEEEEDFDVRIVKSFFLGWLVATPDSQPVLTSADWTRLSAYAWAASFAGYEDVFVAHAAYWAGRAQDPYSFNLPTVDDILANDGEFVTEKVLRSAAVLERQSEYMQVVNAEHDAHTARLASEGPNPWNLPDFGDQVIPLPSATPVNGGF